MWCIKKDHQKCVVHIQWQQITYEYPITSLFFFSLHTSPNWLCQSWTRSKIAFLSMTQPRCWQRTLLNVYNYVIMHNKKNDKLMAGLEFQNLRSNKSSSNNSVNYSDNLHNNALSNLEIKVNKTIHRTIHRKKNCAALHDLRCPCYIKVDINNRF